MRILIDAGHPAHVHLFKNFAFKMLGEGHKVLFTCKDRENVVYLMNTYRFDFKSFGKHYHTVLGKVFGLVKNELQMLAACLKFKPDVFLSHGSTLAAFTSSLFGKPHIAFEDTFNLEQVRLSMPFTDVVLTGIYPHPNLGRKELHYPGYHELAYLHPNVFAPDESVFEDLGLARGEKYAVVRFIAYHASHDFGHVGISANDKLKLVESLSKHVRVIVSSEAELQGALGRYQLPIKPEKMHDVLAFASLFIGESGTMATECAVLGVPNIQVRHEIDHNKVPGVHVDLVHRGLKLLYLNTDIDGMISKSLELIDNPSIREQMRFARQNMLEEMIDVTGFLCWFVQNFPQSMEQMCKGKDVFRPFRLVNRNLPESFVPKLET